ncbi:hypothetical protein [Dysgonomonas sp. 520]|uniref:DUF6712 family protein n=1 Tax=Dysgonomonas sp. 520 TaxID=2302931 RepID=UPI0013D81067|nr:hypothetical protein [Dysgonomonas sp. 520]
MKHLTTIEKIKQNTRFVSKHIDDNKINLCIEEAERLDVKPQIGDDLFLSLMEWVENPDQDNQPDYTLLMQGGVYQRKDGQKREFKGLQSALNYYVYARLVKMNNFSLTRFGFVEKQDQYSQQAELKERLAAEKDARSIADTYMVECLEYLRVNNEKFTAFRGGKQKNRLRISSIGD